MKRTLQRSALMGVGALCCLAGSTWAQDKVVPTDARDMIPADAVVGQDGYRRVYRTELAPMDPVELAEMIASGKNPEIDATTGELVVRTFTDYLPQGWMKSLPENFPAGVRVDSMGRPIVNDTMGLPAWSQADVNNLRAAVLSARDALVAGRAAGEDVREREGVLGNFVGQAIARNIGIDDIVNIDDNAMMSAGVSHEVLNYLHFYEGQRYDKQDMWHYDYTPTQYSQRVGEFITRHGRTLQQVQALEAGNFEDRGVGCYNTTTFARGMSLLTGSTTIWDSAGGGIDDSSADISTGFPVFYFYDCNDPDNNDTVRVGSNGYVTFFQQGGNATNGTSLGNDPIPDNTQSPDGFAGPFWDDLLVTTTTGDFIRYQTEGAVNARVFTAEYYSVSHFGATTGEFYYFQCKLYETSGVVEFHYGTIWSNNGEESATRGMENFDASEGHCAGSCTNTNTDAPANDYRFTYFRPSGDSCGAPRRAVDGSFLTGNLHRASNDGDSNCGNPQQGRDVWFRFQAPCAGSLNVSACGSRDLGGNNLSVDTTLSAHTACPGNTGNQVACSGDAGIAGCDPFDAQFDYTMTDGEIVYVRLSHYGNDPVWLGDGQYQVAFNFTETGAAPFNDTPANAIEIFNGTSRTDDLGCATNDSNVGCASSNGNQDIWYTFVADCDGTLTVNTIGTTALSGLDSVISAHSDLPATNANMIACDDQGGGSNDSAFTINLTHGQRVYIRASYWTNIIGDGRITINATYATVAGPAPANDACANAVPVSCDSQTFGTNCNATAEPASVPACGTSITPGVWYRVMGNGATLTATTCNPYRTFDTKMQVFEGSCGALTCVTGNDDSCDGLGTVVTWPSTRGTVYYVLVNGFAGNTGSFRLDVSSTAIPNDDCSGAIVIGGIGNTLTGNIFCATNDSDGCFGDNREVWYRGTAGLNLNLRLSMCGTVALGMDPVLAIYSGCPGNFGNLLRCNDDGGRPGCAGFDSYISYDMTAGEQIWIKITHFGSTASLGTGNYVFSYEASPCDSIDFNGDGLFPDTADIDDFIAVFAGLPCPSTGTICNTDLDFNNDGLFPDTMDIDAFLSQFAGGPCIR